MHKIIAGCIISISY